MQVPPYRERTQRLQSQAYRSRAMWPCSDFTSSDDDGHNTCSNGSLLVREPSVLSCVFVARRRSIPRKGWTQIEVPHGWTQLIRGVRPKSEKWPRAERNLSAVPGAGSRSQVQRGRWRQPIQRASPEESQHAARQRVLQLESPSCSLRRFERSGGHHVARIIEVRTSCSSGSAVGCATRTVRAIRDSCSEAVGRIGRGTSQIGVQVGRRPERLRVETAQRPQETNPTAPVPPPDWAAELQRLQSLVCQLQGERIQLGPRHLEEELQDLRWEVDALRHERDSLVAERRSVGSDTTMAVVGVIAPSSDRMAALIEEGELKRRKMEAALSTT